jgi:hypothetical protein
MKKYFKTHPYAKIGLLVIPLVVFTVLMGFYFPEFKPEGYPNFIVAFEFAKSLKELNLLLSPLSPVEIEKVDIGNYIDFGYMVIYSLFLLLFFRKAWKIYGNRFLFAGIPLSILILAGDFYENILLLEITNTYSKNGIVTSLQPLLDQLHLATWIKWGGLTVAFFMLFFVFIRGKFLSKIAAVFCLLPIIEAILLWITPLFSISDFTLSVFAVFTVLIVYSFVFKKKIKKPQVSNY